MKRNLFFRADGNKTTGLGHVSRSLALAGMLADHFHISFVTKESSELLAAEATKLNIMVKLTREDHEFLEMLHPGDLVVLDGYHFGTTLMEEIISKQCLLIYTDDLHDRFIPAHLIINQHPEAYKVNYEKAAYTKVLGGFDYALLRQPFLEAALKSAYRTSLKKAMIVMGGTDPYQLTLPVIDLAAGSGLFEEIHVVSSDMTVDTDKAIFHRNISGNELAALMLANDLIICPASGICIEAIAAKLHIICGYFADNQESFYTYLTGKDAVIPAGDLKDHTLLKNILQQKELVFPRPAANDLRIDGHQRERYISAFRELAEQYA